jgi:hypothetical protein
MADSAGESRVLAWDEISHAAEEAFAIWSGQPELEWARCSWQALARAGLATYRNERERCQVAIRLLALAGLYHDFCAVAWEEYQEPQYVEWAEGLGIGPFRVGQLVGGDRLWDTADDDDATFAQALEHLVNEERQRVLASLREGYGDVSGLFVSLWRSRTASADAGSESDGEGGAGDAESDDEILNDVTTEKLAAFAWLESGCPTLGYANE